MEERVRIPWEEWELVKSLGKGGFGEVWEIERIKHGITEKAAMKVISIPQGDDEIECLQIEGYTDESITQRFSGYVDDVIREYGMMVQMKGNANIVYCDDYKSIQHDDGFGWDIYIKMELLTPLMKALKLVSTEQQIIQFAKDICSALVVCQKRKVIHRDIKPQNIFVSEDGVFKLGDFGIARKAEKTTRATVGKGTYQFMAPEVKNELPYGPTVDIYSLGLVMYWLLNDRRCPFFPLPPAVPTHKEEQEALHRRFSGEQIPAPKNGSKELKRIILKACAFDPKDRYQTAQEMREALARLSGEYVPGSSTQNLEQNLHDDPSNQNEETVVEDTPAGDPEGETVGPIFKPNPAENADDCGQTVGPVFRPKQTLKTEKRKHRNHLSLLLAAVCVAIALFAVAAVVIMNGSEPSNVLMADVVDLVYDETGNHVTQPVFGSNIMRDQVKTITFLSSLEDAPDTAWDVSEKKDSSVRAWVIPNEELYDLYIAADGGVTAPENGMMLFALYSNVVNICFNDCFYTDNTVNAVRMFYYCTSLRELDLSGFKTGNVVTMHQMFNGCGSLGNLDIGSFDTSNVQKMSGMFALCWSLSELDVTSFDTSNVIDMNGMFHVCSNLRDLDVRGFNTSNVTDMSYMFASCDELFVWNETNGYYEPLSIDVSNFDVSLVQNWNNFVWIDNQEIYIDGKPWTSMFEDADDHDSEETRVIEWINEIEQYRATHKTYELTELISLTEGMAETEYFCYESLKVDDAIIRKYHGEWYITIMVIYLDPIDGNCVYGDSFTYTVDRDRNLDGATYSLWVTKENFEIIQTVESESNTKYHWISYVVPDSGVSYYETFISKYIDGFATETFISNEFYDSVGYYANERKQS